MNSLHTFLFFGRSGCGKGTQAKLIREKLISQGRDVLYIETGAELRDLAEEKNPTAEMVSDVLDHGDFLPPFIPIWVWTNAFIRKFDSPVQDLILDGLARRIQEAPILDSALRFYGRTHIHVIHINVSRDWSRERMTERGRADDNPDEIERRLSAFDHNVVPVLEYFKNQKGYDFYEVDGMHDIEDVHRDIVRHVWGE
jgi:adenylate kinase family enzyme